MLVQLAIRDIVLIDRLEIDFGPGLTVLTGETGAGKSILLDAFALALGGRGDGGAGAPRRGAGPGDRRVRLPPRTIRRAHAAAEQDIARRRTNLILRRVQMADGRTRAFINDQPVSVQTLRAHRRGAGRNPRPARRARAGRCRDPPRACSTPLAGSRRRWPRWRAYGDARERNEALATSIAPPWSARAREADYLRHAADELAKLARKAARRRRSPNAAPR